MAGFWCFFLTFNRFYTSFWRFCCWIWTIKCCLGKYLCRTETEFHYRYFGNIGGTFFLLILNASILHNTSQPIVRTSSIMLLVNWVANRSSKEYISWWFEKTPWSAFLFVHVELEIWGWIPGKLSMLTLPYNDSVIIAIAPKLQFYWKKKLAKVFFCDFLKFLKPSRDWEGKDPPHSFSSVISPNKGINHH